uniref:Uncharacterized protein n=1 Tax=Lotharella oceanica TaxID=641309 RepID=A0A7S2TRP0_9EUKA|mmetsp:Transcript_26448/g.49429  ORF Transcript_26448/g.49429 Transcript_26448/m.49429 type:complete len:413 (+) Transcript_26448:278-1516(+)
MKYLKMHSSLGHDSEYFIGAWSVENSWNTILELFFPPWTHGRRHEENKILPDEGRQTTDSDGNWFVFVNGMMCSRPIVEMNRCRLKKMLNDEHKDNPCTPKRICGDNDDLKDKNYSTDDDKSATTKVDRVPVHLFHNVPDSFLWDLIQCYADKEGTRVTKPTRAFVHALAVKLNDPTIKKVVVLCHSQGTIIVAAALKLLGHLIRKFPSVLSANKIRNRLEIYCFATCANTMHVLKDKDGNEIPMTIEHFTNSDDIVAKLGISTPQRLRSLCELHFDGRVLNRSNGVGHLFNSHYLDNIKAYKCEDSKPSNLMKYVRNPVVPGSKEGIDPSVLKALRLPRCAKRWVEHLIDILSRIPSTISLIPVALALCVVTILAFVFGLLSMFLTPIFYVLCPVLMIIVRRLIPNVKRMC